MAGSQLYINIHFQYTEPQYFIYFKNLQLIWYDSVICSQFPSLFLLAEKAALVQTLKKVNSQLKHQKIATGY